MNNTNWYQQQERGAGNFRLELLFFLYKVFGPRFVKFWVWLIAGMIGAGARGAKESSQRYRQILNKYQITHKIKPSRFSTAQHIRAFADSLVDKMIAMCDKKNHIKIVPQNNNDWREFQELLSQKNGIFLVCSHIGNIEALAAYPDNNRVKIHAFQAVEQSGIFHRFISKHSIRKNTFIYPVEDMNLGTASEMFDYLNDGDLVMMAGDRISANNPDKTIPVKILDQDCKLPMGVFRFAKSMAHPIFAVTLINIGHEKYKLTVKKLCEKNADTMANEFAQFLTESILTAPTQWFNFYNFFYPDTPTKTI